MDWKDRITSEKSLFDVYRKARGVASARSNVDVALVVLVVVLASLVTGACLKFPDIPYNSLAIGTEGAIDVGFTFTTAILGFLIAGFAIFASITKPDVFILLAKLDHKRGGISRLQFIFFNFIFSFIHYLLFLGICISIKVMFYDGSPFVELSNYFLEINSKALILGIALIFSVLIGWLIFLLMLLKSFIWNMYQAVLVTIVAEAEIQEQAKGNDVMCCDPGKASQ